MRERKSISVWPITKEQAAECLYVNGEGGTHSFWIESIYMGCDLRQPRIEEMLSAAEQENKLYLVECPFVDHGVAAWDSKSGFWTFLRCCPAKLGNLRTQFANQRAEVYSLKVRQRYLPRGHSEHKNTGGGGSTDNLLHGENHRELDAAIEILKLYDNRVATNCGSRRLLDFVDDIRSQKLIQVKKTAVSEKTAAKNE